jgi:hypothetical protein
MHKSRVDQIIRDLTLADRAIKAQRALEQMRRLMPEELFQQFSRSPSWPPTRSSASSPTNSEFCRTDSSSPLRSRDFGGGCANVIVAGAAGRRFDRA